jgi:hypothetical protein
MWWMYFRELEPVRRIAVRTPAGPPAQPATDPIINASAPEPAPDRAATPPFGALARFQDDDDGYRRWLREHPNGLVVNCERRAPAT